MRNQPQDQDLGENLRHVNSREHDIGTTRTKALTTDEATWQSQVLKLMHRSDVITVKVTLSMQEAHSVTSNGKGLWGDTQNKVVFRQGISLEYDHIRIPLSKGLVCYADISLSWLFLKTDAIYSHALCWSVISTQVSGLYLSVTDSHSSLFPTEAVFSKEASFGSVSKYNKKLAVCLSSVTHQTSNMHTTCFPQIRYHHSLFQPWSWGHSCLVGFFLPKTGKIQGLKTHHVLPYSSEGGAKRKTKQE